MTDDLHRLYVLEFFARNHKISKIVNRVICSEVAHNMGFMGRFLTISDMTYFAIEAGALQDLPRPCVQANLRLANFFCKNPKTKNSRNMTFRKISHYTLQNACKPQFIGNFRRFPT